MTNVIPAQLYEPADRELAAALADDDTVAFRGLYRRYVGKVRSTLVRLTSSHQLDDLTQEVFLRIWRARGQVRATDTLGAWIYRITVNVAMDALRARERDRREVLREADLAVPDGSHAHALRQLIGAALMALDFPHRAVLVLHDLEDLSEREVAAALGIPPGTVKSRLHHARRRVRDYLAAKGEAP